MTLSITIHNNHFILHCSGAMYWVERQMLLISDVHLGKVTHFRRHGAALPAVARQGNFKKLDSVMDYFNPAQVCFLGDLFHSSLNRDWNLFREWRERHPVPMVLVAGNHDIISPHHYEEIGVTICSEWILDGFLLAHYPEGREGLFTFCGHVHPAVLLAGPGRQFLRLSCFFRSPRQLILPAFGEFTGTYTLEPSEEDMVYAVIKDEVIEVK